MAASYDSASLQRTANCHPGWGLCTTRFPPRTLSSKCARVRDAIGRLRDDCATRARRAGRSPSEA
jgi:hypothetical protein